MRKSTAPRWALWFLIVALASPAAASSFHLTRIADLNTAVPDGTGAFFQVLAPVLSGNKLAFLGYSSIGYGVYLFDGSTLSRVADTSTPIPDGTGTFTVFETVLLDQGNLAFVGVGESGQRGIYLFDGSTIRRIADLNTQIPDGTGNFTGFGPPAISGSNVVFVGGGSDGQQGIYLFVGTTLSRVADLNTQIPNGTGTFTRLTSFSLGPPGISEGKVAFLGFGESGQQGIYLFGGTALSRVADTSTAIPGSIGNFDNFFEPSLSDGIVGFVAFGGFEEGIYLHDGSTLSRVVDTSIPIPMGTGKFQFAGIGVALFSGSNVAFPASGSGGQLGIYLSHDSILSRVADLKTAIPNGVGTFTLFSPPVLSGHNVAFVGTRTTPEQQGVYLFDGSRLGRVADTNTAIPNGAGNFGHFESPAVSGDNVAFLAPFGIYLASPAAGATLRLGLRNGDDVGTAFDLRVEVTRNGSDLVASGLTRCVRGLGRNPAASPEIDVAFEPEAPVPVAAGDTLSLKVSARIGTNADDSRCTGTGASHGGATGLRLYYDAAGQASRFDATVEGAKSSEYLHSDGGACSSAESAKVSTWFLDDVAPTAAQAKCKDSRALTFAGGNPWSEIGTWTKAAHP